MASKRTAHDPEAMKQRMTALMDAFGPDLGCRTPTDFARAVGIAPSTWANYIRDGLRPQIDEARKLVEKFGVTLDWIYLGDSRYLPLHIATRLEPPSSERRAQPA